MKLEKAIEILEILSDGTVEQIYNERIEAIGLGIEALKRIKAYGGKVLNFYVDPLPGETEE